jgi:hypothetical protein
MKLRSGRLKDDYDISQIAASVSIDEARLRTMVTSDRFTHFLAIKDRS